MFNIVAYMKNIMSKFETQHSFELTCSMLVIRQDSGLIYKLSNEFVLKEEFRFENS